MQAPTSETTNLVADILQKDVNRGNEVNVPDLGISDGSSKCLEIIDSTLSLPKNQPVELMDEPRRRSNAVMGPNQLPSEILAIIINLALPSSVESNYSYYSDELRLAIARHYEWLVDYAQVSRVWATAVFGTPSLWTLVNVYDAPQAIANALRLSKQHALEVWCDLRRPQDTTKLRIITLPELNAFAALLAPHFHRCRSATFRIPVAYSDALRPLLETANSGIGSLEFRVFPQRGDFVGEEDGGVEAVIFDLFAGDALNLRTLILEERVVPSPALLYMQLHTIELRSVGGVISLSHLLAFMDGCSELKNLTLERVEISIDITQSLPSKDFIALEHLNLQIHPDAAQIILLHIRSVPSCTTFILEAGEVEEDWLTSSLNHLFRDIRNVLVKQSRRRLREDPDVPFYVTNRAGGYSVVAGSEFSMSVWARGSVPVIWSWFAKLFEETQIKDGKLCLIGSIEHLDTRYWSILRALPLRHIQFTPFPWEPEPTDQFWPSVLQIFAVELGTRHYNRGREAWSWPRLSRISMRLPKLPSEGLTAALTRRYAIQDAADQPTPLTLDLECLELDVDQTRQIRAVLGAEAVSVSIVDEWGTPIEGRVPEEFRK